MNISLFNLALNNGVMAKNNYFHAFDGSKNSNAHNSSLEEVPIYFFSFSGNTNFI